LKKSVPATKRSPWLESTLKGKRGREDRRGGFRKKVGHLEGEKFLNH